MQVKLIACIDASGDEISLSFLPATKDAKAQSAEKMAVSRIVRALSADPLAHISGLSLPQSEDGREGQGGKH